MFLRSLSIWLADISDCATLLAGIFILVYTFGKRNYLLLTLLLLLNGILKVICVYLAYRSIHNMPFYHLIGFLELTCIYLIYQQRLNLHLFWHLLAAGVTLTYILNSVFIQSVYEVNSLALAINQLFVLILASSSWAAFTRNMRCPTSGGTRFFTSMRVSWCTQRGLFLYIYSVPGSSSRIRLIFSTTRGSWSRCSICSG